MDHGQEYENTTQGGLTAIKINPRTGLKDPIYIAPGEHVWLTEEEAQATANAPQRAQDNPFNERDVKVYEEGTLDEVATVRRAPLTPVDEPRLLPPRPIGVKRADEEQGIPA